MAASGGGARERDVAVAVRRQVAEGRSRIHPRRRSTSTATSNYENLLLAVPGDLRTLKLADFGFAVASASKTAGERRSAAFAESDGDGDR